MVKKFFTFFIGSFITEFISCFCWLFITELLSSFIYPETNHTKETISLILIIIFLFCVLLKLIFQLIVLIIIKVTTKKQKVSDVVDSDESTDSEDSDNEQEKVEQKFGIKKAYLICLLVCLIFSVFIHLFGFNAIYTDWKYYTNNYEEFGVDVYGFFERKAFIGPIKHTNGTQPISSGAVSVWVLHCIGVILIILSMIIFTIAFVLFFIALLKYQKSLKTNKQIEINVENVYIKKEPPIIEDLTMETLPDYDISVVQVNEKKPIETNFLLKNENKQIPINPDLLKVTREESLI